MYGLRSSQVAEVLFTLVLTTSCHLCSAVFRVWVLPSRKFLLDDGVQSRHG